MKIIFALIAAILLTSCTGNNMKPTDFKDQKPRLIIEEYLSGNVKAWGILQNRSGKVTRQFSADLNGEWDGKQLILRVKNLIGMMEKFKQENGQSIKLMIIITKEQQEMLLVKQKVIPMDLHLNLNMFY